MEIASAVVGECTKSAIVHVEREFGYLIHFRNSTHTLKGKIQQLTAIKSDVQAMIDAAVRNGESIKETVQDWMTRADLVLGQATKLSNEASIIKGWFRGWCCSRFSLGRKAEKKILVIQELSVEGSGFVADDVSYPMPNQSLTLVGIEGFNAFASRDSTAENIRRTLLDDAINLVGVYGMPGVGKTTLIESIAKQVKEEKLFQEVVLVTVSQEPNLMKLQGNIAERLDLEDLGVDLSVRAGRLFTRLNQDDKTTLVILDDVWKRVELSKVGIPYKNMGKCCKVVFTTRSRDVCDIMEADTKIKVAVLLEEDSWILFQQKSGNVEDSALARDLVKECNGLPLALVTLGLALRNKDAVVWADTLAQLRKSIFKGMSSVHSSIKLSYKFLESESVKICLLFCCLFPEDHKIQLEVLLNYVMGENVLEDVDTCEEARGRLHGIVDELVSSSLLLRDGEGNIMMHDVVRDVAISIAAKKKRYIVKAGRNLSEWPDMELGNCKRLSMMHNSIQGLPTFPIKAPHLQALFLNDNKSLTELPSDLFADMKSLITLDLSRTCIESLPPSLSCLENLHTLLLNEIRSLNNLSVIEKIERLEILSLRDVSLIEGFPEELGNNLKLLDLNGSMLKLVRSSLFSKLHRLEALHFCWNHRSEISEFWGANLLREVGSLSRLTLLELSVSNYSYVEIPGPWENLTRFRIMVNTKLNVDSGKVLFLRSLWLNNIRAKEVANWVLVLLGRTNCLELNRCPDLHNLTELGDATAKLGMNENLKLLELSACYLMECLVRGDREQNAFLSNLEKLRIQYMPAFRQICKGTPPPRLLCNLKKLSLVDCFWLTTLIPRKLIHNFQNLESLKVYNSPYLRQLVEMEEEEESVVSSNSNISRSTILPYLNRVEVSFTNIKYVFTMKVARNLLQLEKLQIHGCSEIEILFKYEEDLNRISEPLLFPIFPNLKTLTISNIPKIRYVFTMRVARNLLQLLELDIENCEEMEVIIKYEDGEDIQFNQDTAILPSLKMLTIEDAPQLKSFTNQNLVMELPSLEKLYVLECFILERLPFGTTSVPNLSKLYMEQECLDRLEWEDESIKARLQAILKE